MGACDLGRFSIVEAPILVVQAEHIIVVDLRILHFHTPTTTLVNFEVLVAAAAAEIAPLVPIGETQGITAENERSAVSVTSITAKHLLVVVML